MRDRIGSGGGMPVSVTVSEDKVYVLNEGAPANITGFKLSRHGHLAPLPNSTRLLGDGAYAQIAFDSRANHLIVTDKAASRILVYRVRDDGLPAATPAISPSSGSVPFGVAFDKKGHLLVVEAGSNAVSSYDISQDGGLQAITVSSANGQLATCWIAVNQRGDVITANPGTHSLSAFHVDAATGQVILLNGTAGSGDAPLDIAMSENGRFVYALDPAAGGVAMFKIEHDGSLTGMGSVDAGLSLFAQGMAVR
jgi:6-phosphogluconolactonase (cycloisomerase 2 family)